MSHALLLTVSHQSHTQLCTRNWTLRPFLEYATRRRELGQVKLLRTYFLGQNSHERKTDVSH